MHTFAESDETLKARGQYSILRAVHEDKKGELRDIFTVLQSYINDVFKLATANEISHALITDALSDVKRTVDKSEIVISELESLARQRQDLRNILWPK